MARNKYYLGIDVGTSGTKTLVMSADGAVITSATAEYPLSVPQNGWAEQDPLDWADAAAQTIRDVLKTVPANDIAGVGLTGQMHGLTALDKDNKPIRPALLWCDQRTAKECDEINAIIGEKRLIELTANPALTGFTSPKILWMRNNEPDLYAKIEHILLPKDYIRFILTGDYASDLSDASGTGLVDVAGRDYSAEVLEKLRVPRSWLPKLYESPEITGYISDSAAKITGLIAGTPVAAGAGDNAAGAIGTGVTRDGEAFCTIGSSGVVFAHSEKMITDPLGRVHTFCAAVPGEWHTMGVTLAAGLSLSWFKNNFAENVSYKELDALASAVPVGADRLIYLPYLNGERTPHKDSNARGVFFGLSSAHTRANLTRAVLEGVVYSLRDCYEIIVGMGGNFSVITACGGGSVSPLWRQMLCDALGVKVDTAQTSDGPAFGAAILASVGAGEYPSVQAAASAIVRKNAAASPEPTVKHAYDAVYARYTSLYGALKGEFKALGK